MKPVSIIIAVALLTGCGPKSHQTLPSPEQADSEVDTICEELTTAFGSGLAIQSRDRLVKLETLAKRRPEILADSTSAAAARKAAGKAGSKCPVVENRGRWFVLIDEGHPAADGFYAVVVVDTKTKQVLMRFRDSAGNAPIAAPAPKKENAQQ